MNQEQLLKIIRKAEKEGAVELDLSDHRITYLPPEIGRLTSLQVLIVRGLIELPKEIASLRSLTRLYLSYNQLTELPEEVSQLRNLTRLYLNSNQLSELPKEIDRLKNLNGLYLSYNHLDEFPEEILGLRNLTRLYLSYNQLSKLPPKIALLKNLNIFDLSYNQLIELPGEIGQLRNLTRLFLNSNELVELPKEISQLKKLTELHLSANQLLRLPKEISNLKSLALLYLDSNKLSEVPEEISRLRNLRELNLGVNQLREVPREIPLSERLIHLDLGGNPLTFPPPEIASQGLPAIRNYLQESGKGGQTLYECKLMVVGQGGVGKTCLVNRLISDEYVENGRTTKGIDIHSWKLNAADDLRTHLTLNVWDFGGQEIYHATHQFFLTPRSLYILVWDACQEEDHSRIDYWLNAIETFAEESPIIIVMNKSDERSNDLNFKELKERYPRIVASEKVSAKSGNGIESLRNLIRKHAWKLPLMGTFWPTSWLTIRRALRATSRYYLLYRKYLEVCSKVDIDEREAGSLSRYLHDLGIILHFRNDPLLRHTMVLSPSWGTDAVYRVLDAKIVQENSGILYNRDLPRIWTDQKLYPRDKYATILRLMANFELAFPFGQRGCHIVVEFLSPREAEYAWNPEDYLQFEYHYDFLPAGIITRLIVRMHEFLIERDGKKLCWREGAYFEYEVSRASVRINPHARVVVIQIDGIKKHELLAIIRSHFFAIHKSIRKIRFIEKIPCMCTAAKCRHRFDYNFLLKCEEKGIESVICEKTADYVSVIPLLDSIEKAEFRWERIEKRNKGKYPELPAESEPPPSRGRFRTWAAGCMLVLTLMLIIMGSAFLWIGDPSDVKKFFKDRVPKVTSALSWLADIKK
ncbi:COR domain-containing protein [Desulfococcaceae bacterium HSG8]|nr:COR domain-containing protein [Desulfococcaceae bacterium HSG8]